MAEEAFDPAALIAALQRHDISFVVVGGIAAIAQGAPLPTYDIDVTPQRGQANVERLVAALIELHAKLRTPTESVPFPLDAKMLMGADAWRLSTSAGPLDLVFEPAGTRGFDDLARHAIELDLGTGAPVLVASIADVIRMKEAAAREKDRAQLPGLRRTLELLRERERERRR